MGINSVMKKRIKVKLVNKDLKTVSEIYITETGFEPTAAYLVNKCSTIWSNWPSD